MEVGLIDLVLVVSAGLLFWCYVGYFLFLYLLRSFIIKKSHYGDSKFIPFVSIVVVARNEEKVISQTLDCLLALDYPKNRFEIVVASDQSDDNTHDLVETFSLPFITDI